MPLFYIAEGSNESVQTEFYATTQFTSSSSFTSSFEDHIVVTAGIGEGDTLSIRDGSNSVTLSFISVVSQKLGDSKTSVLSSLQQTQQSTTSLNVNSPLTTVNTSTVINREFFTFYERETIISENAEGISTTRRSNETYRNSTTTIIIITEEISSQENVNSTYNPETTTTVPITYTGTSTTTENDTFTYKKGQETTSSSVSGTKTNTFTTLTSTTATSTFEQLTSTLSSLTINNDEVTTLSEQIVPFGYYFDTIYQKSKCHNLYSVSRETTSFGTITKTETLSSSETETRTRFTTVTSASEYRQTTVTKIISTETYTETSSYETNLPTISCSDFDLIPSGRYTSTFTPPSTSSSETSIESTTNSGTQTATVNEFGTTRTIRSGNTNTINGGSTTERKSVFFTTHLENSFVDLDERPCLNPLFPLIFEQI